MKKSHKKRVLYEIKNRVIDESITLSELGGGAKQNAMGIRMALKQDLFHDFYNTWKVCGKRNRTQ